ncbi:glycosyltransferase family 4 protein [Rhodococcus fascians]|uniref:glycosyltransferase family 4 protein n=1 Tax=Rhodococcoides fascians TaxID=1828 RepID=UPI0024B76BDE|nr:glycosyltransferase family 4 protein [Rhodococcus fascians]MDJ0002924.1 glycosyltransferase family 4 protein [Rhodococcus fascians]
MIIVFAIASLTTKSGLWNVMLAQAKYLTSCGHEVHLVCSARFEEDATWLLPDYFSSVDMVYETSETAYRLRRRQFATHVKFTSARTNAHLLVSHTPQADLVCKEVCSNSSLRWLPVIHNWPIPEKRDTRILKYLVWKSSLACAYRRADSVVAVSEGLAQLLKRSFRFNSVIVVQNGVRTSEIRQQSKSTNAVFGMVGRLSEEKDPIRFVRILAQSGAKGVIVGSGPLRDATLQEIGTSKADVEMLGWVDRESVFDLIDVVVMPSRREGLPLVLLEACARGIPVIATAVGGVGDVLGRTELAAKNCLVPTHASDSDWIDRIVAMHDPNLRASVGTELAEVVASNFQEDRQLEKFGQAVGSSRRLRKAKVGLIQMLLSKGDGDNEK